MRTVVLIMKKSSNNQSITQKCLDQSLEKFSKRLDENLDERFEEHSKIIIEAVNHGFEENKKAHQIMETKIDETANLIDGYVKAQEDFKQEFTILKSEVDKIKEVIKNKLGIKITAL